MKRGESGLSLLVAIDKPSGLSSHDVVNRVRSVFGERRVGHTGTLDPLASGVLPICVGPATRLDRFMVDHDKRYRVIVRFGSSTTTDDSCGEVLDTGTIPSFLHEGEFASTYVAGMVGGHEQVPPAYSAIKVNGRKAYESARKGEEVALAPRHVEVYDAKLVGVNSVAADELSWVVDFHVSKGTYIRALARDMGKNLTCPAHVEALQRLSAGRISLEDCLSLESVSQLGVDAAIDPVRVLGLRFAFGDGVSRFVESGNALREDQVALHEALPMPGRGIGCACTNGVCASDEPSIDGELAAIIVSNRLKAIYRFDGRRGAWKAECVFSTSIYRG